MLRQALDDAEAAGENRKLLSQESSGDLPSNASTTKYGTSGAHTGSGANIPQHPRTVVTERRDCSSEEGGGVDDDDEDDEDFSNDTDSEDKSAELPPPSLLEVVWMRVKTLFRVVANVENLWDSPPPPPPSESSLLNNYREAAQRRRFHSHKKYVVLFWFVVLALSYAGERSTFKVLVDRTGPFRLFSVQMLTGSHAVMLSLGLLLSAYNRIRQKRHNSNDVSYSGLGGASADQSPMQLPLGIPYVDCILMAVLDTITLVVVFLTGEHVPPTLTVILVQFTIPLAAFLSQFTHPDGHWTCCKTPDDQAAADGDHEEMENRNPLDGTGAGSHMFDTDNRANTNNNSRLHSNSTTRSTSALSSRDEALPWQGWGGLAATHVYGSLILVIAVSLALCPAFYSIAHPEFFYYADQIPTRTAINTLFFVSSCIPAAASQLYKEHIFLQHKQPVNMVYLNLLLSVFQFVFCSIASPLLYGLQGLGSRGDWTKLYPASGVSENFFDGLKCYFGLLDLSDQQDKYPEEADCRLALGLVLLHVFSIISVGVAVDKIVNAGATKVMYRGISAGIIVAVLSMHYYDMQLPDFAYGPAIDALNLVCLVLLVLGSEVYHRTGLQEATFETVYPTIEIPDFDD